MDKPSEITNQLKELSVAFGKISEEFKTICAAKPKPAPSDPDGDAKNDAINNLKNHINDIHNHISYVHSNLHDQISNVHDRINKLSDMHHAHASKNHLPPLQAGEMQKLLDVAGASQNYNVVKPNIYASRGGDMVLEAAYIKPS